MEKHLQPTSILDFDHPDVKTFVQNTTQRLSDPRKKAVNLFYSVENDAVFHFYNHRGQPHMGYLNNHSLFDDLPLEHICETYRKEYTVVGCN